MALAQRQRARLRQQQAVLVARAHEEERAWVAGELHDDVLQRVALVRAEIEPLWASGPPGTAEEVEERLRAVDVELVDLAVAVRNIATRLHPTLVDQIGLLPALDGLADEVRRGSDLDIRILTQGSAELLAPEPARAAYRIVQESLRNVVRHAQGRSANVHLEFADGHLSLRVQDDGRGFDASTLANHGLGLASLRERALAVGGTAEVRSRPGAGTTIAVRLPMTPP